MYLWPGRAADGAAAGTSARPQALQPVHAVAWKCVTSLQHVLLHLGARMGPASTIIGQNKAKLSLFPERIETNLCIIAESEINWSCVMVTFHMYPMDAEGCARVTTYKTGAEGCTKMDIEKHELKTCKPDDSGH